MNYRGYNIVKEKWDGDTTIWVETPEGPFDAPTVRRAKEYVDAIIEENEALAAGTVIGAYALPTSGENKDA